MLQFPWNFEHTFFSSVWFPQVSRDGGLALPSGDVRGSSDIVEGGRMALDNKTSLLNTQPPRAFSGPRAREYNPYPYADTINTYDKTALKEAVFDDDMDQLRDGLYQLTQLTAFLCICVWVVPSDTCLPVHVSCITLHLSRGLV